MSDDALLEERQAWVAWSRLRGLGPQRLQALWQHHGSLARAWRAPSLEAERLAGWDAPLAARAEGHRRQRDPAREWAKVQRPAMRIVAACEAAYPAELLHLPDPPPVLYIRGRWPLAERRVSIVGTRHPSPYGRQVAKLLARELAALGVCVVSGGAEGIDAAAHEGALAVGATAAVLGGGFDHPYPLANRGLFRRMVEAGGTVLTEYPPDVTPAHHHFPHRNRLIAALSAGVIVAQADLGSGTRHTVEAAQAIGREVLAVPGPIQEAGSRFPHRLVQEGSALVGGLEDICEALGWALIPGAGAAPRSDLTPLEERLWRAFERQAGPTLDQLMDETGLTAAEAGAGVGRLVLKGLVQRRPGGRYERRPGA